MVQCLKQREQSVNLTEPMIAVDLSSSRAYVVIQMQDVEAVGRGHSWKQNQ